MKRIMIPILVMVFICSLVWIAGAQTSKKGTTAGEMYGSGNPQRGSMEDYRGSKLIGTKIQNPQGDNLGKIEDLALNARGQIDFVIVSHGGALGIGEKYAAVPFSAFSRKDDKRMILDMSKEKMAQAPNFDKDKWPDMSNRQWSEDVYHHYGQKPYGSEPSQHPGSGQPRSSMEHYRASKLIGAEIQNPQGDALGKIEDLALNARGRADFIIVSHDGAMGIGEKYAAVPFSAFSRKDDKTMILDMSKEKMAQAPNFDKDKWPDMSNRQWSEDVYRYYGQKPYWSESSPHPVQKSSPTEQEKKKMK